MLQTYGHAFQCLRLEVLAGLIGIGDDPVNLDLECGPAPGRAVGPGERQAAHDGSGERRLATCRRRRDIAARTLEEVFKLAHHAASGVAWVSCSAIRASISSASARNALALAPRGLCWP